VAEYDALVAARYWRKQYSGDYPSDRAAVAGAGSRMLAYLFPEQSALRLDRTAELNLAGETNDAAVAAGLELGRAVAGRVIAFAEADGSDREWDGARPPLEPAFWAPPPGSVSPPVQPTAGTWKTWAIDSGAAFRPPAPPVYGSPEYLAEARELVEMGSNLTAEQRRSAKFWEGGEGTSLPPGVWIRVVLDYLSEHPVSRAEQIRTLALVNVAFADAGVASWDAKYAYWTPRPENAIRDLMDPGWQPYLRTPLFPAYVSGHSTYSAAAAEVLAGLYPDDARRFREMAEEAGISRLLGGIHWRSDHVQGARMGREIGKRVLERGRAMTGSS
jgi:membrane-associated phospholipid phosphatase